jgi:hypothetical protein
MCAAWGPFGAVSCLLALVIAFFPRKLPRAAQRAVADAGSREPDSWTRERSFRGKKVALLFCTKPVFVRPNSFFLSDKIESSNYRRISLLSTSFKILFNILLLRLSPYVRVKIAL